MNDRFDEIWDSRLGNHVQLAKEIAVAHPPESEVRRLADYFLVLAEPLSRLVHAHRQGDSGSVDDIVLDLIEPLDP